MDYLDRTMIKFYKNFDEFLEIKKRDKERIILMTTKASKAYTKFNFNMKDTILFGRESAGVPNKIHNLADNRLKIPMSNKKRSLNLSTSVAIVLSEAMRQNGLI